MENIDINATLGCIFGGISLISIAIVVISGKQIYGLGILLIFPSLFFFYKMAILTPPLEYFESEKVCGFFYYSVPLPSSRASDAKGYFFEVEKYGRFEFSSRDNRNNLDLIGLEKNQRVCLVLERRKDKANDLSLANLISIER